MIVKVHNPSHEVIKKRRKLEKVKKKTSNKIIDVSLSKPKKRGASIMKKRKRRKRRVAIAAHTSPARKRRRRVVVHKKRRRKNPTRKVYTMRTHKRRQYTPKRRKARRRTYKKRRNPSFDFLSVIQTSVLAGIGGIIGLGGTVAVSRIAKIDKDNQKNLVTLGIALFSSIMLPKVLKKDQADALLGGLWTVTWLRFIKQVMPSQAQEFLVLGANEPKNVDYLVNRMLGAGDYSDPELELLGTTEQFGTTEQMGYSWDQYDAQIW